MKIGVTFPQTEIGNDPNDIKLYGEEVESIGFSHILAYEHVVGANLENRPNWNGVYSIDDPFHEPFVLFSFLSSITSKIKFFTGVIILPQRPVVLVAKQAASLDILSNGRLELGIGLGWNDLEYDARIGLGTEKSHPQYIRSKELVESVIDKYGKANIENLS